MWAPVSIAEPWHIWLRSTRNWSKHVDFIAVHMLPYWEGIPVDKAVDYVVTRYDELQGTLSEQTHRHRRSRLAEQRAHAQAAVASPANQAKFLRRFLAVAEKNGYTYYIMEAFDQIWKGKDRKARPAAYWGVYDEARQAQVRIHASRWSASRSGGSLAAISIAPGDGAAGPAVSRQRRHELDRGRGFLAVIAYAIATFAVWMVYDFTAPLHDPGGLIVGIVLLLRRHRRHPGAAGRGARVGRGDLWTKNGGACRSRRG